MRRICLTCLLASLLLGLFIPACGDDDEANDWLIGAECATDEDCDDDDDDTPELDCLTVFGGGYCGLEGCESDMDCPEGSLCADLDGTHYCFLVCTDKSQCNVNRSVDFESNCSSNVDPLGGGEGKLCVPPSSGV